MSSGAEAVHGRNYFIKKSSRRECKVGGQGSGDLVDEVSSCFEKLGEQFFLFPYVLPLPH